MHLIFFLLGLIVLALGALMIGFGIPIQEFGLGNTLILAGTVAVVGGLLLTALAAALGQLRRIVRLLGAEAEARARDAAGDAPQRDDPLPFRGSAELSPEPLVGPLPAVEPRRSPVPEAVRPEPARPPVVEPPAPRQEPPLAEVAAMDTPPPGPLAEPEWPREGAAPSKVKPSIGERIARASAAGQKPTLVKSGKVEGRAYALYSDGTIDAEFDGGKRRFRSLDELRDFLARHSRN